MDPDITISEIGMLPYLVDHMYQLNLKLNAVQDV